MIAQVRGGGEERERQLQCLSVLHLILLCIQATTKKNWGGACVALLLHLLVIDAIKVKNCQGVVGGVLECFLQDGCRRQTTESNRGKWRARVERIKANPTHADTRTHIHAHACNCWQHVPHPWKRGARPQSDETRGSGCTNGMDQTQLGEEEKSRVCVRVKGVQVCVHLCLCLSASVSPCCRSPTDSSHHNRLPAVNLIC